MVTLWNRSYIFSGKIKLPIVEQIIRDAIEYDSYSTGEVILPPGHEALWAGGKRVEIAFLWGYAVDSTASLCNNRVYYHNYYGLFRPFELVGFVVTLREEARKKIAAKCRCIGRELNGIMRNPRPP